MTKRYHATFTNARLDEHGRLNLVVGHIGDDGRAASVEFDIDSFALEAANQLLATVVQQKARREDQD